jgi:hypothetical protein
MFDLQLKNVTYFQSTLIDFIEFRVCFFNKIYFNLSCLFPCSFYESDTIIDIVYGYNRLGNGSIHLSLNYSVLNEAK